MTKTEYLKQKELIIQRLGKAEYDMGDPVNESAREIKKLYKAFKSEQTKAFIQEKKQVLDEKEQKEIIKQYKSSQARPIDLSDNDLAAFNEDEKRVVLDYFRNTNLTPSELARQGFNTQRVVALMRSGPFVVLAARVFEYLMPIEVRNAALKAVRDGDKRLIERFAEQTGVLKNQEMNLNINKPLEDVEMLKKLKELGDSH